MQSTQRMRWLIASTTDGGKTKVLSLDDGGRRVLPVFSFREEAEMYARLQLGGPCWRPRVFSAGEIVSLLYGPLAGVTRVALDPLPEFCDRTALRLICVDRRSFVRSLFRERREGTSRRGYATTSGLPSRESCHTTLASPVAARGTAADRSSVWPGGRG